MYRKFLIILTVLLLITTTVFAQGDIPKVFINGQEVNSTVINGELYIPISELVKLNLIVIDYQGSKYISPKPGSISDIDTAYQVLTELHEKFLERLQNSSAKTKDDTIKLLQKNSEETFYDLIKLSSIQIEPTSDIATNIFLTKNYFIQH